MTDARSADPTVWVSKIQDVADPPGTQCFTYASCVQLLQAGTKINFDGAGGPDDFNQYHNVFTGWDVVQFDSSGKLNTLYSEDASMLASY